MALIGLLSMPKQPIDFSLGQYTDTAVRTADRISLNCYPESTPGDNPGAVLRAVENYQIINTSSTRTYGNSIIVGDVIYGIEGVGQFFSIDISTNTYTAIGNVTSFVPHRLASNGLSIVMVNTLSTNPAHDWYYDIGTATLATIPTKDANYTGYGKAKDVVFKDGYYVFVTAQDIFHGDNATVTGDGLVFNPLSFAPLPAKSGSGVGLVEANSQIYVFTATKTFIYQTVATTPFSFARNTGFDMEIGLSDATLKIAFDDRIFLVGKTAGAGASAYLIEGQSYQGISNTDLDADLRNLSSRGVMSTLQINGHRFVTMTAHLFAGSPTLVYVFDFTETKLRGYPVWHTRDLVGGRYPAREFFTSENSSGTLDNEIIAMGIRGGFLGTTYFQVKEQEVLEDATYYSQTGDRFFEYSFSELRASGDPFMIKKVRLQFSDNVKEVELFQSTDGLTYTTLGEYDIETSTTKLAEWRRINRFSDQVAFKVRFQPVNSTDNITVIGGYFEI